MSTNQIQFETIPCSVCGKPMPKKRLELGYRYCVNCSTEKPKVCLIEGTQEGDGTQSEVIIMTPQEAKVILGHKNTGLKLDHIEDEAPLNTQTYEEQEESEDALARKDLEQLEDEFEYELSERVSRDLETIGSLSDEDLETEIILEENNGR